MGFRQPSREYVLQCLDSWFCNRAKNADALRIKEVCKAIYVKGQELMQEYPGIESFLNLEETSGDPKQPIPSNYFTQTYSNLETLTRLVERGQFRVEGISEEMQAELFNPLFKEYQTMNQFVDAVREKTAEIFPEDLKEKDIDAIFIDIFKSVDGFSKFAYEFSKATLGVSMINVHLGKMSEKEYSYLTRAVDFFGKVSGPLFHKVYFSDLMKHGQDTQNL